VAAATLAIARRKKKKKATQVYSSSSSSILSSGDDDDMEESKKRRKQRTKQKEHLRKAKKAQKKANNVSYCGHKSVGEAHKQRAVAGLYPEDQKQGQEQERPVDTLTAHTAYTTTTASTAPTANTFKEKEKGSPTTMAAPTIAIALRNKKKKENKVQKAKSGMIDNNDTNGKEGNRGTKKQNAPNLSTNNPETFPVSSLSSSSSVKRKKRRNQGEESNNAQKKAYDESNRRHKPDDQAQKQRAEDRFVPVGREQGQEQEQPVAAVKQAEKRGVQERGSKDMVDSALNVPTNSHIAKLLMDFGKSLHHIAQMQYQLQARLDSIVASQNKVEDNVEFLCGRKNNQFSCSTYSACGSTFEDPVGFPGDGITTVVTTQRTDKQLSTRSYERKTKQPTAQSPEVEYYKNFTPRQRDGRAAVNLGAHAGLNNNSNVTCYSNAVFQCIASCITLSDFSPSENHPQFPLNHAFASLMNSMIRGEECVDPSFFMNAFTPLFQPQGIEIEEERQGMYYDCA
jgi:hypothetical protein